MEKEKDINGSSDNIQTSDNSKKVEKRSKKSLKILLWIIIVFIVFIAFIDFLIFAGLVLGFFYRMTGTRSAKPIIYLYPTSEQTVSVQLGYPDKLTHTYPKYEDSWEVIAKPNGDLTDLKTGKGLYSLYWEGINSSAKSNISEGFCVKGENTATFLEEKLAILGLNERESEEFIIYSDTLIRVLMEFKGVNSYVEIPEQKLDSPVRTGFVAVEWGGTEI